MAAANMGAANSYKTLDRYIDPALPNMVASALQTMARDAPNCVLDFKDGLWLCGRTHECSDAGNAIIEMLNTITCSCGDWSCREHPKILLATSSDDARHFIRGAPDRRYEGFLFVSIDRWDRAMRGVPFGVVVATESACDHYKYPEARHWMNKRMTPHRSVVRS